MTFRIAIIGLGDIAQKAYLPLLTSWEGVEALFCTRRQDVLESLQAQYRVAQGTTNLDILLSWQPQAAFVLASTPAHYSLAHKLLSVGVDVYRKSPPLAPARRLACWRNRATQPGAS